MIENNQAMNSRKLFQMSVLHCLLRHCKTHRGVIARLVICAILLCTILLASIVEQDQFAPYVVDSALESQEYHLVVCLQDEDEDDDDDDEPAPDRFANWNTTEAKVFGARRFILKQEFQMELDRINAVCKLEPKQIKKLNIASKGGVKKALKEWRKKTLTQFGMFNQNGINAEDDADREPIEEKTYKDASDIDTQTLQLASNAYTSNVRNETIANNSFWKKTLESTLLKEQKDVWEDFITQQRKVKREEMADAAIEKLNFELALTPEQKRAFIELVRPEMLEAKLELVENVGKHYENYLYLYHASKVKESKLKKVLTKAQLQRWKIVVSTTKNYSSWFEDRPARVRNWNVWERQGFGVTALLEVTGAVADAITEFATRIFKNAR